MMLQMLKIPVAIMGLLLLSFSIIGLLIAVENTDRIAPCVKTIYIQCLPAQ